MRIESTRRLKNGASLAAASGIGLIRVLRPPFRAALYAVQPWRHTRIELASLKVDKLLRGCGVLSPLLPAVAPQPEAERLLPAAPRHELVREEIGGGGPLRGILVERTREEAVEVLRGGGGSGAQLGRGALDDEQHRLVWKEVGGHGGGWAWKRLAMEEVGYARGGM